MASRLAIDVLNNDAHHLTYGNSFRSATFPIHIEYSVHHPRAYTLEVCVAEIAKLLVVYKSAAAGIMPFAELKSSAETLLVFNSTIPATPKALSTKIRR